MRWEGNRAALLGCLLLCLASPSAVAFVVPRSLLPFAARAKTAGSIGSSSARCTPVELRRGRSARISSTGALSLRAEEVVTRKRPRVVPLETPYPNGYYDPSTARRYFATRKRVLLARSFRLLRGTAKFFANLRLDQARGKLEQNQEKRAQELVNLIAKLGPTFVKIGQALSIRTDLLPLAYSRAMTQLQDKVPPFPNEVAYAIIEEELGLREGGISTMFEMLSEEPVASASLGQVYKGQLWDGTKVAVKVQRPDVMETIACDLFLLRASEKWLSRYPLFQGVGTYVNVIDGWGRGFVDELNYKMEAENMKRFQGAMQSRGYKAVTTPDVIDSASSGRVLTTKWIDGERLDKSSKEDVGKLCGIALNAYLTMMLDCGVLHCDPHPGNLLRTTDGKLCILDWGLVLQVDKDLQFALVDFISHLLTEDYNAIPGDLTGLRFVSEDRRAEIEEAGLVDKLSGVLEEMSSGGQRGLLRVDFNALAQDLIAMTRDNGDLFQIPPYMAYILRTYTVLEGIGLQNDPNYAIVQECFPYIARRLVTDTSPRTQQALRKMLYGSSEGSMNATRLANIAQGFGEFQTSTLSLDDEEDNAEVVSEALDVLLSPEGNYVQSLLLEELARVLDAVGKDAIARGFETPGAQRTLSMFRRQMQMARGLGPGGVLLMPWLLPGQVALSISEAVVRTPEDEEALELVRKLSEVLRPYGRQWLQDLPNQRLRPQDLGKRLRQTLPKAQELAPGAVSSLNRLAQMLLRRVRTRLPQDPRVILLGGEYELKSKPPTERPDRTRPRRERRT